ncbi:3'-5' exoribonuclease [Alkalibacter rhizosphaerae]|uniref:3'-5' exoribonuclease n=1 Tax=Alkalibacter rhizosphaerae TaxID=2815577 RepID=A0A975AJB6_9FIRM|nr:exonuclease domain-containing protein [Alkalibacter rhizosphaerae]QSX09430.1 3'-5' exoribonuclease [Alkalibacter rhizosphaerae]
MGIRNFFQQWGENNAQKKTSRQKILLERDFIALDVETTGFHVQRGDRIISLGAVKIKNGKILREDAFYTLVNPDKEIPQVVRELTGIDDDAVASAPDFESVMKEFVDWSIRDTENPVAIGHAITFDLSFLKKPSIAPDWMNKWLDTREIVSLVYPGLENKSLFHIAEFLECSILVEHHALEDAILSAEVFLLALEALKEQNVETLESLRRMQKSKRLILPSEF